MKRRKGAPASRHELILRKRSLPEHPVRLESSAGAHLRAGKGVDLGQGRLPIAGLGLRKRGVLERDPEGPASGVNCDLREHRSSSRR